MDNPSAGNPVVFLLGAGFSVDAASEAGNPAATSPGRPARYPLVHELLHNCFRRDDLPSDKSIEDLFQDSIDKPERGPLDTLYRLIMEADYYITPCLKRGEKHEDNVYRRFLRDFPKAPLLTFNYDSLPEILLLGERLWRPEDGYGIRVQAELGPGIDRQLVADRSLRPVLHLHGSLCVYPVTYYFEPQPGLEPGIVRHKDKPDFYFDPDKIADCFFPFLCIPRGLTYTYVAERAIAPVPNKAEGLKGDFIEAVYKKAKKFLRTASQIVVIGYSFNRNDRASYAELLAAIGDKPVLLVDPDAASLTGQLAHDHPDIHWRTECMAFKEWVSNRYPGI